MIVQPPNNPDSAPETAEIDRIVASGPQGAIVVAGIAVGVVIALWLAFYWLVFLPRAPLS